MASIIPIAFRKVLVILGIMALVVPTESQFDQDVVWQMYQGRETAMYRRNPSEPYRPVITPKSNGINGPIVVYYNCYYMPAICTNLEDWKRTPRAMNRALMRGLDPWGSLQLYAFDLDKRTHKRRGDAQCPESWRRNHACPEILQPPIMPDGWRTSKEPDDEERWHDNEIESNWFPNPTDPTQRVISQRSGRYYTCEEWPPRSFVEGGTGIDRNSPGMTYCAPMSLHCGIAPDLSPGEAVNSEQDWQALAHGKIRRKLNDMADEDYGIQKASLPLYVGLVSIVTERDANGPPARVGFGRNGQRSEEVVQIASVSEDGGFGPDDLLAYAAAVRNMQHSFSGVTIALNGSVVAVTGSPGLVNSSSQTVPAQSTSIVNATNTGNTSILSLTFETATDHSNSTSWPTVAHLGGLSKAFISGAHQGLSQQSAPLDIIDISEQYILGNLKMLDNTTAGIQANGTFSRHNSPRRATRAVGAMSLVDKTPLNKRDGPVQCGPGSPCKDDSCCSADGKCGYKQGHCGAGCQSNCNAKAMCGIDSVDGKTPCALNLCCSYYGWCGTETVHCLDPEPQFGVTPCQQGFGSCAMKKTPSCAGSSASSGRKIAYYQGWNSWERKCDKITPSQINTKGLTHLFYAFVFFDPSSFEILAMDQRDIPQYSQFTALASNSLQTWVAIGGWSFSDPGPTATAWSDMVSSPANRATFIASLLAFMDKFRFQGADLDWEYPGDPKRGGRKTDPDNLVLLVKEMRSAFGSRYGLSATLAPDYWYLRGFKPREMQPYVDWLGFMAYDLHGPWDTDVKALGSFVRPHTDWTEIEKNLKPLWWDGVDPSKVVIGLAYYGRTYQLEDASCGTMAQCKFKGPGAAGECTAFQGVLSNREIRDMIKKDGLQPRLNTTALVKYMNYAGDSWVGFDDEQTIALKTAKADSLCLGGTMIWSIDFDATVGANGGGNNGGGADNNSTDLIWVDPKIWQEEHPSIVCSFPCTAVLPPFTGYTTWNNYPIMTISDGAWTTTITQPPVTTTVWWVSTVVVGVAGPTDLPTTTTTSTSTNLPIFILVTPIPTPSWPIIKYTNQQGEIKTTRPPPPPPPPPPVLTNILPTLTFVNGLPPTPTIRPFPTPCVGRPFLCPPAGWTQNSGGGVICHGPGCLQDFCPNWQCPPGTGSVTSPGSEEDGDDDEDDDDDENEKPVCTNYHGGGSGSGPGNGSGNPPSSPTNVPAPATPQSPDTSQNVLSCYGEGQKANRVLLIDTAKAACTRWQLVTMVPGNRFSYTAVLGWDSEHQAGLNILVTVELKDNCLWRLDLDPCINQLMTIIDSCSTDTTRDKMGGTMQNNCLRWRIDPEYNASIEPPPPPPPPAPSVPNTPNGKAAQFDIWATRSTPQCSKGPCVISDYGLMGIARFNNPLFICAVSGFWRKSLSSNTMPQEIKGIEGVFGRTCDYQMDSNVDFGRADEGSIVGHMKCPGWDDAECVKRSEALSCEDENRNMRVRCMWE